MRSFAALAMAGVLAGALGACGGHDSSKAAGDSYCSLAKQAPVAVPQPPAGDPQHLDLGAMNKWLTDAVAPLPGRTAKIVAVAPDSVKTDWTSIQTAQQGLVDNLGDFLDPAAFATWQGLPKQQQAVQFLTKVLQPLADLDRKAPERINAEVKKDCGFDLGLK
ncbi:hypothetical protein [Nocardioides montaniterrae]